MFCTIAGVCLILVGCDRALVPENDPPIPVAKSDSDADSVVIQPGPSSKREAVERTIGDYKFMVPPHWKEKPPKNEFISAEFSIAGEDGPGRITISAAGGGLEPNLDRWRGQFHREPNDPEPRESSITLANTEGKLLELHGTFRDGFGGGQPQAEWSMLGAAIPLSSTNLFLKLTGPRSTVAKERDHFLRFIETARK